MGGHGWATNALSAKSDTELESPLEAFRKCLMIHLCFRVTCLALVHGLRPVLQLGAQQQQAPLTALRAMDEHSVHLAHAIC